MTFLGVFAASYLFLEDRYGIHILAYMGIVGLFAFSTGLSVGGLWSASPTVTKDGIDWYSHVDMYGRAMEFIIYTILLIAFLGWFLVPLGYWAVKGIKRLIFTYVGHGHVKPGHVRPESSYVWGSYEVVGICEKCGHTDMGQQSSSVTCIQCGSKKNRWALARWEKHKHEWSWVICKPYGLNDED